MGKAETELEWRDRMCREMLKQTRSELYMDFRFLDVALCQLIWQGDESIDTLGTDGEILHFSDRQLFRVFSSNPVFMNRAYLHTVLHCLFAHLWMGEDREQRLWHLSCDIMVEYVIDHMKKESVTRILSFARKELYGRLEKEPEGISAASIYRNLFRWGDLDLEILAREFYVDTHKYWPQKQQGSSMPNEARQKWDQISRQSQMDMEGKGQEEATNQALFASQIKAGRSKRNYRDFLRRFAVLREELKADPDEFDINFYSYGLRYYGNMPLVEPLESRERMKVQEFVVVLDTSYSTKGELVKGFLGETFGILMETDAFFEKSKIIILQCDDQVREEQIITNRQGLEQYLACYEIVGEGGTDFRPAFQRINALLENGELKNLRGVIYFTDGKGTFPMQPPSYETVFAFVGQEDRQVPPWAMKITLEPEQFGISIEREGESL